MYLKFIIIIFILISSFTVHSQIDRPWNNKKCAVVLTYDDGLNVHLDKVIPVLDSFRFKATFYIAAGYPSFKSRINDWRKAAAEGHEIGNHTLFHPCEGSGPGRQWVKPEYDLSTYTVKRMVDEIKMANEFFTLLDGKTKRTFAYPCGDTIAGDSSYVADIKAEFTGARSVEPLMQKISEIDLFSIGSYVIDGQSGDELIRFVQEAIDKEALLVFLFHGVGGEHSINEPLEDHNKLLQFLKANEKDVWVVTLNEAAEYIRAQQEK